VEVVKGQFTRHKKLAPLAGCSNDPTCAIRVFVRNEKGSDVNLASRLLHDAHLGRFELAIVVSGDSDLAEPIRLVTRDVGKTVWVRNPRDVHSQELQQVASDYARIRAEVLRGAQLPDIVTDGVKSYHKPAKWTVGATIAQRPTRTNVLTAICPLPGCGKTITTCRYI